MFSNVLLPRFRTREDADKFMDCIRNRSPLPPEIMIVPFIRIGDVAKMNPEYQNAHYECQYLP